MKQRGLFDEDERLQKISALGDPLEKLDKVINWNIFRPTLTTALRKEAKGPGGRPPYDYVMMFKILILQRLYNISDAQTEYQIQDRLSFMRFLGLTLKDAIPDEKTIWYFREQLVKEKVSEKLFKKFLTELEKQNLISRQGSIIDATLLMSRNKEILKKTMISSRMTRFPRIGINQKTKQRNHKRTWMPVGQRNWMKRIMDTRLM